MLLHRLPQRRSPSPRRCASARPACRICTISATRSARPWPSPASRRISPAARPCSLGMISASIPSRPARSLLHSRTSGTTMTMAALKLKPPSMPNIPRRISSGTRWRSTPSTTACSYRCTCPRRKRSTMRAWRNTASRLRRCSTATMCSTCPRSRRTASM